MAAGKNVLKSVRMTDELYAYVDAYRGDGFSDKFSNLVMDSMFGARDREKRLSDLDAQIVFRKEVLQDLVRDCEAVRRINSDCTYIVKQMDHMVASLKDVVSQPVDGESAAG